MRSPTLQYLPNMQRSSGFILFALLIVIHIFSVLNLFVLMHATSALKMTRQMWEKKEQIRLAYHILGEIEMLIQNQLNTCTIKFISAQQLKKQSRQWWQNHTCRYHEKPIYYAFIELDKTCTKVADNKFKNINFYQIFLCINEKHKHKIILQSVVAITKDEDLPCRDNIQEVKLGRQIWLEI